jgi:hypothetical protein
MRHDLHIEIDAPDSLGVRDQWTAIAEGLTAANVAAINRRGGALPVLKFAPSRPPRGATRAITARAWA